MQNTLSVITLINVKARIMIDSMLNHDSTGMIKQETFGTFQILAIWDQMSLGILGTKHHISHISR